jgi:hypothetical protein
MSSELKDSMRKDPCGGTGAYRQRESRKIVQELQYEIKDRYPEVIVKFHTFFVRDAKRSDFKIQDCCGIHCLLTCRRKTDEERLSFERFSVHFQLLDRTDCRTLSCCTVTNVAVKSEAAVVSDLTVLTFFISVVVFSSVSVEEQSEYIPKTI